MAVQAAEISSFPVSIHIARMIRYAVKGVDVQRECNPPGNLLLQPVAIEAAVEETKLSESSMERVALAAPRVSRP